MADCIGVLQLKSDQGVQIVSLAQLYSLIVGWHWQKNRSLVFELGIVSLSLLVKLSNFRLELLLG
jgi:hypothetical protein